LVLTFDKPIDGGAFLFAPNCLDDTKTQGAMNSAGEGNGQVNTMIRLGPGNYGFGATGSDPGTNNGNFGTVNATIMHDKDADPNVPAPKLIDAFWKSKIADFTYRPTNYAPVSPDPTKQRVYDDIKVTPEPSTVIPLCLAGGLLLLFRRRRIAEN
jgi:hypothetical protein